MAVYLLHFSMPYKHAKHYLGFSHDLNSRLLAHKNGCGARLTQVIQEHGIGFVLARVWPDGDRHLESRLKGYHSGVKLCPICKEQAIIERLFGLVFKLISRQAACRLGSRDSRQKRLMRLPTLSRKKLV